MCENRPQGQVVYVQRLVEFSLAGALFARLPCGGGGNV